MEIEIEKTPPDTPVKRVKLEDGDEEKNARRKADLRAAAEKRRADEDKWRKKWIKFFPTLIFHFEIGAEEGPGKALMQKLLKLDAVSVHVDGHVQC
jgi:hypothetical protein